MRIGFDLSRVIIEGLVKHRPNFVTNGNVYLPSALSSMAAIVEKHGANQIFIVSCVKSEDEGQLVREWFASHGFYARTGVLASNVLLCHKRSEKRTLCIEHDIDVFVDDRLEVLGHMAGVIGGLFLFQGRNTEIYKPANEPYWPLLDRCITRVGSWGALAPTLLR
jgi:hypothetical protein